MNARKIFPGLSGLILAAWLGYLCAGPRVAQALAARSSGIILRATQGKVAAMAVPVFIEHRMQEALWLATLALLWGLAHWRFESWRRRRDRFSRNHWAIHGIAGFIFLNLWIAAASNTALFWGALGAGAGFQNLMQFQLKRILMQEYPGTHCAVLMGNSQTRAQIDENQLNDFFGARLWTTELHWPGSQAFDLLLVERQIRRANPQFVICYLTEGYFYLPAKGESVSPFFEFRDIPDCVRLGAFHQLPGDNVFYGVLGSSMSLFRCRDILAQRFLGDATVNLKQVEYNASLASDLQARAKIVAASHKQDRSTNFQKQAFEEFISRCQKAGRRVILFAGQSNPILDHELDPALHADMMAFLDQLKSRYRNVILIPAREAPTQTAVDYEDLSHVNKETQKRFTAFLAGRLAELIAEPPAGSTK